MAGQKILNTPQMCSKSKDPDPYYEKKADPDLFIHRSKTLLSNEMRYSTTRNKVYETIMTILFRIMLN